jgi:hypothetical protein
MSRQLAGETIVLPRLAIIPHPDKLRIALDNSESRSSLCARALRVLHFNANGDVEADKRAEHQGNSGHLDDHKRLRARRIGHTVLRSPPIVRQIASYLNASALTAVASVSSAWRNVVHDPLTTNRFNLIKASVLALTSTATSAQMSADRAEEVRVACHVRSMERRHWNSVWRRLCTLEFGVDPLHVQVSATHVSRAMPGYTHTAHTQAAPAHTNARTLSILPGPVRADTADALHHQHMKQLSAMLTDLCVMGDFKSFYGSMLTARRRVLMHHGAPTGSVFAQGFARLGGTTTARR